MIKEAESVLNKPKHGLMRKPEPILKRLNFDKSTKTMRKLGLFGYTGGYDPDFEWTLLDKISKDKRNLFIEQIKSFFDPSSKGKELYKLCGLEWKE